MPVAFAMGLLKTLPVAQRSRPLTFNFLPKFFDKKTMTTSNSSSIGGGGFRPEPFYPRHRSNG
jgi:hypothetical protein